MSRRILSKAVAVGGLVLGLFLLAGPEGFALAGKKEDAAKHLSDLKAGKDAKSQVYALEELAKIGQIQKSAIKDAVPEMMKALESKDATVRAAAAKSVGMIDPDPKEVIPILVKMMTEDKDEAVKMGAIAGLGQMGENAKDAVKDLRKVVADEDKKSKLGKAAQQALKVIVVKKK